MRPDKNQIFKMWALLVLSGLCLTLMYYLPERIGSWELKPVDLLSDIRVDTLNSMDALPELIVTKPNKAITTNQNKDYIPILEPNDSSTPKKLPIQENKDAQSRDADAIEREVKVVIEDYSVSHTALARFYRSLEQRQSLGRPVRIAVLGDSFIEGDIFTSSLRNKLQAQYGGGGVGWMPMMSNIAGFRTSVRHEASGWTDKSVMSGAKGLQTILGHYFIPQAKAYSRYTMTQGTRSFNQATLYYTAEEDVAVSLQTVEVEMYDELNAGTGFQSKVWDFGTDINTLRMNISNSKSLRIYGLALESSEGVSVDNISLRGSSGFNILSVDEVLTQTFCRKRSYDLIILQYGLNVANAKQSNYNNYAKTLNSVVAKLRTLSPHSDVLIMSVSDRANKTSQGIETMKAIYYLHQTQQTVAEEQGCAFWSTLRAMHSIGGIVTMAKKGQAAKDYTHLTHKGGEVLAELFIQALNTEQLYYANHH